MNTTHPPCHPALPILPSSLNTRVLLVSAALFHFRCNALARPTMMPQPSSRASSCFHVFSLTLNGVDCKTASSRQHKVDSETQSQPQVGEAVLEERGRQDEQGVLLPLAQHCSLREELWRKERQAGLRQTNALACEGEAHWLQAMVQLDGAKQQAPGLHRPAGQGRPR